MKTTHSWRILVTATVALFAARSAMAASPTTSIALTPATVTLNADQSQTFVVTATHADGTTADVTSGSGLSNDDPLGSMTGSTYHPGKVGAHTIQATFQSFKATATVTVTPGAVAEIVINPNTDPEQTYIGRTQKFTATLYDSHSNVVTGTAVTWSVIGDVGTIDKNGVFTPTTVSTGKIQAKVGYIVGEVAVQVNQALPTNTNTVVTSTTANTNAATNKNTNATKNANVGNANSNRNTNAATVNATKNTNVSSASQSTTATTTKCTTLKTWVWVIILIVFLAAVAVFYGLFPVTAIWPVLVALVAAGVMAYVERKFGCGSQNWWTWVVTLGTIILTALGLRQPPKKTTM